MKNPQSKIVIGVLAVIALAVIAFLPGLSKNGGSSSDALFFGKTVFGHDLDSPSSVIHFIVRGDEIFVDQNQDNIPQPEELNKDKRLPEIQGSQAGAKYRVHELRLGISPTSVSEQLPQQLGMTVDVASDEFSFQQLGTVVLSTDPLNSSFVQFNGPLSLIYTDDDLALPKGGPETAIRVLVGTKTKDEAKSTNTSSNGQNEPSQSFSLSRMSYVVPQPDVAAPQLRIEYPTNDQPIVEEFRLDTMC